MFRSSIKALFSSSYITGFITAGRNSFFIGTSEEHKTRTLLSYKVSISVINLLAWDF
ncbi:hypothetical protein X975_15262, partial [Stegodyphus mimosarum]